MTPATDSDPAAPASIPPAARAPQERHPLQEKALLRLHAEVRDMKKVEDWEKVLFIVVDELNNIGVAFTWASVLLVDLDAGLMHGFGRQYGKGEPYRITPRPLQQALRQVVIAGQVAYRPDLWTDDPYRELEYTQRSGVRSVVDVPFAGGTVALSHTEPEAFAATDIDFLFQVAQILSDGILRVEDLRNLEERNLELEREVVERRQVEQRLRESEERFKSFFEYASTGMAIVAVDGCLLQVNPSFCQMLGYTEPELLARTAADIAFPADLETQRAQRRRLLAGEVASFQQEERYIAADGHLVWGLLNSSIVRARTGEPLYFIDQVNDITEHKRLEGELMHLERLRAQHEIAAAFCHNLNNILTGIQVPAQSLQLFSQDEFVHRQAEIIDLSAQRAAQLVERLYQAMRPREGEDRLKSVAVKPIVEEVIREFRQKGQEEDRSAPPAIAVTADLEEVPLVRGTPAGLRDLLVQLLTNAVEATPADGAILIRARSTSSGVELAVRDTGIGMEEETRRRVFEPFFTTKAVVGAGLGLSTVYGTVTKWGGHIEVESAPGQGTTFLLTLPVWEEAGDYGD